VVFLSFIIAVAPLVASVWAWVKLYRDGGNNKLLNVVSYVSLGVVTLLSAFAVCIGLYFAFGPPTLLPPWESPEPRVKGHLIALAPMGVVFGLILGFFARRRDREQMWLFWTVECISYYLLFYGFFSESAV